MVSLAVVIFEILSGRALQVVFTEEDYPIGDFSFERAVKSLKVRVGLRHELLPNGRLKRHDSSPSHTRSIRGSGADWN